MRVKFISGPNGSCIAETTIPVNGGSITLRAVTTRAELQKMLARRQGKLGFKLSLHSLGRAMKAIAKPATLLKITAMAGRLSAGDPTALLSAPDVINQVKKGMAAKRVVDRAASGDPTARRLVAEAAQAAQASPNMPAPPGVPGQTWRYLVTLEKLAQQGARA